MAEVLALFGGTFDPVHRVHLAGARAVSRLFGHCRVHLLPNAIPPHRPQPLADGRQRLAMLEEACATWPRLVPDDWELRQPGPSWTLLTLRHFRGLHPGAPLVLVIGADSLATLDSWYRWREYARLCHLVVLPRPNAPSAPPAVLRHFPAATPDRLMQCEAGLRLMLRSPALAVSSTAIRQRLAEGGPVPELDPAVREYIQRHRLYNAAMPAT